MFTLKNDFIVPSLKPGYAKGDGMENEPHPDFYGQRSKHPGAVALKPFHANPGIRKLPVRLSLNHKPLKTES